jgi:anti-sigma regulatory factor (Ser/Thr protein kinase)
MRTPLQLDPKPQSVGRARAWVVDGLQAIGRDDLVDAAELGVSELVTNAILHADPPITLRLRGTPTHPRVEVHDNSARPPAPSADMTGDDRLLSTVGRGLGLLALYSRSWGADLSGDGKVVWFEPTVEPGLTEATGEVFDLQRVVDERLAGIAATQDTVTIRLLGLPVPLFAGLRHWYVDLRRELRLLGLTHGEDYPLATELSELGLQVEQERRLAVGLDRLEDAIAAGEDQVDLVYQVPRSAGATMRRLRGLLDQADDFAREQRLLTLSRTDLERRLTGWYLTEFERQAAGEEPRAWSDDG